MARSIPSMITPTPTPTGICRAVVFWFQSRGKCPTVGPANAYKGPRWAYWKSATSNSFWTAKTATLPRTVHVRYSFCNLSFASGNNCANICTFWSGAKSHMLVFERPSCFFTMPHPRADLLWQMPHRGEGGVKKCLTSARGDERAWNWSSHYINLTVREIITHRLISARAHWTKHITCTTSDEGYQPIYSVRFNIRLPIF